ncbi:MAG: hypothetical protein JSS65_11020 [Armatimonadetes bacterium]|nr:hypothetical protein [Armatimonadota bacterium]
MGSPYVEYPRGSGGSGGNGSFIGTPRGAVDLAAISEAWDLMKANWSPYALTMLLVGIANFAITFVVKMPFAVSQAVLQDKINDPAALIAIQLPGMLVQQVVSSLLTGIILGGFANMTLVTLRGGQASFNDFMKVFSKAHLFMLFGLLYTFFTLLGVIGLCVGSIVVAGLLMFSAMFMVDREMGPWDAIKASFNALKGEWLMAGVFYFVAYLIALLGILACGVGILFTAPMAMLAVTICYRDVVYVGMNSYAPSTPMSPPPSEAPTEPPVDQ